MKRTTISRIISTVLVLLLILGFYPYTASTSYAGGGTITGVFSNYDLESVEMHPAWTEGEVNRAFLKNLTIDDQNGISLDKANSTLMYMDDKGQFIGIGNGENPITHGRAYYFKVTVSIDYGYELPDKVKETKTATKISEGLKDVFTARLNGISTPQKTYISTNQTASKLYIYYKAPGTSDEEKIVSVTVDEDYKSIIPGNQKKYTATVKGYASDMSVKWSLSGAEKGSVISSSGLLYVTKDETAEYLTIVARSSFDNTKKYAFGVYINHNTVINGVDVTYDPDELCFNPISTQGEAVTSFKENIGNNSTGCSLLPDYSGIVYRDSSGTLQVLGTNDTNHIDPTKNYMMRFGLKVDDGYTWPACLGDVNPNSLYKAVNFSPNITFAINGKTSEEYLVSYNYNKNVLILYAPLEITRVDIGMLGSDLQVTGIQDKIYSGKPLTQNIKVTAKGYTLKEGVDYSLSYDSNTNVGEAWLYINGIGSFKGVKGLTFKISDYDDGKGSKDGGDSDPASTLQWKQDAKGWWVEDANGWYPTSQWLQIDGKWYYFCADGYMDYSEYRDGCWLGADGAWAEEYYGGHWCQDMYGWWYEDASGWYPVSQWLWIDGVCYYFDRYGYTY